MTFQENYEDDGTIYEIVGAVEFGDNDFALDEKKNVTENDSAEILDYEEILEDFNEEEELGTE